MFPHNIHFLNPGLILHLNLTLPRIFLIRQKTHVLGLHFVKHWVCTLKILHFCLENALAWYDASLTNHQPVTEGHQCSVGRHHAFRYSWKMEHFLIIILPPGFQLSLLHLARRRGQGPFVPAEEIKLKKWNYFNICKPVIKLKWSINCLKGFLPREACYL